MVIIAAGDDSHAPASFASSLRTELVWVKRQG